MNNERTIPEENPSANIDAVPGNQPEPVEQKQQTDSDSEKVQSTEPDRVGDRLPKEVLAVEASIDWLAALQEKVKANHHVRIFKTAETGNLELFLIHKSSLPTNATCAVLRAKAVNGSYGFHRHIVGTEEEVKNFAASYGNE